MLSDLKMRQLTMNTWKPQRTNKLSSQRSKGHLQKTNEWYSSKPMFSCKCKILPMTVYLVSCFLEFQAPDFYSQSTNHQGPLLSSAKLGHLAPPTLPWDYPKTWGQRRRRQERVHIFLDTDRLILSSYEKRLDEKS